VWSAEYQLFAVVSGGPACKSRVKEMRRQPHPMLGFPPSRFALSSFPFSGIVDKLGEGNFGRRVHMKNSLGGPSLAYHTKMISGHYFSANTSTNLVEIFRVHNGQVTSQGEWDHSEKLAKLLVEIEAVWHITTDPEVYVTQVISEEEKVEQFLF